MYLQRFQLGQRIALRRKEAVMSASRVGERGVATSLLEAAIVIAITAVIATVAVGGAMRYVDDARISRATADTQTIGITIQSFMHDTGWAPAFKSGIARGPQDDIFFVLQSDGNDPLVQPSQDWPTDASRKDRLENQLIKNLPGGSGPAYPRMGEIPYSRFKGWNGPYTASFPSSDPWGDRYLVNVQLLTSRGVQLDHNLTLGVGQRPAIFVVSAGPNRQLETKFDQVAEQFAAGGDDVVFRIQ
jgi:type II secretory pathway pseudopilin PulG